jgi:hypothetical protein
MRTTQVATSATQSASPARGGAPSSPLPRTVNAMLLPVGLHDTKLIHAPGGTPVTRRGAPGGPPGGSGASSRAVLYPMRERVFCTGSTRRPPSFSSSRPSSATGG